MRIRSFRFVAAAIQLFAMFFPTLAEAVIALDVTAQSNLVFGQVVATSTSGTVTVSPTGGRTQSGGAVLANGFGVSAASFAVTGEPNTSYSITLPSSCTLSGGGGSLTVDGFTSSPNGTGMLGPGGTQSVTLGATLHVGSGQRSAAYSGTYAITLAYN